MALGELKNGIGPDAYAIYQQVLAAVVERDHPVGSLYISENATSPAELYGGMWERIEDCTIWGASDTHPAGTTVEAGLPSLWGQLNAVLFSSTSNPDNGGVFKLSYSGHKFASVAQGTDYDLLESNITTRDISVYGRADTVQPPAYCTYIWRRVA